MLIDTHCHIHEVDYPLDTAETLKHAHEAGIEQLICVGTSEDSSRRAVIFAATHDEAYASIGVHPHDTQDGWSGIAHLLEASRAKDIHSQIPNATGKIVAIGEIGLDYFYTHSPRDVQIKALEWQIDLAIQNNLPIIFHVREAFDDFWPIFDNFKDIRGELHSFTDTQANLDAALNRGLLIGVNGISTFTRNEAQKLVFASIPLDSLLLETDAPFLTPVPFRGKVNEPAFVKSIAEHHGTIRRISFNDVAAATTHNARALFAL